MRWRWLIMATIRFLLLLLSLNVVCSGNHSDDIESAPLGGVTSLEVPSSSQSLMLPDQQSAEAQIPGPHPTEAPPPASSSEGAKSFAENEDTPNIPTRDKDDVGVVVDLQATPTDGENSPRVPDATEGGLPRQPAAGEDVTVETTGDSKEEEAMEPSIVLVEEKIDTQDAAELVEQVLISSLNDSDGTQTQGETGQGHHGNHSAGMSRDDRGASWNNASEDDTNGNRSEVMEGPRESQAQQEDEEIVTFEEFKTKMSIETANKHTQTGGNIISKAKNNYASSECGAKVIAVNEEAKNSGAILLDNKDVYMLNPCSADIWFVVELCELIKVARIGIGCFELFSSIPEQLTIYASEEYPASEWQNLGIISMRNERVMQEYPLDETGYAKYIKVQQISHYGSEHYCPISMLRVFGASMMEEYEFSESQRERLTQPGGAGATEGVESSRREGDEPTTIGPVPDAVLGDDSGETKGILAATGAILSVIGKAVNGLMGPNGEVLEESEADIIEQKSPPPLADQDDPMDPPASLGPNHNPFERPEELGRKTEHLSLDNTRLPSVQSDISMGKNNEEMVPDTQRVGTVSLPAREEEPPTQEDIDARSLTVTSTASSSVGDASQEATSLERVHSESDVEKFPKQTDEGKAPVSPSSVGDSSPATEQAQLRTEGEQRESLFNPSSATLSPTSQPTPVTHQQQALGPTTPDLTSSPPESLEQSLDPSLMAASSTLDPPPRLPPSLTPSSAAQAGGEDAGPSQGALPSEITPATTSPAPPPHLYQTKGAASQETGPHSCSDKEAVDKDDDSIVMDGTANSEPPSCMKQLDKDDTAATTPEGDVPVVELVARATDAAVATETHTAEPDSLLDEEPSLEDAASAGGDSAERNGSHTNQTYVLSGENGWYPGNGSVGNITGNGVTGGYSATKEKSVFIRLSNRINYLETNMSLFSSYLDQISLSLKRNKNRTEDMQKALERRILALNDTVLPLEERMSHQAACNGSRLLELEESVCLLELRLANQDASSEMTTLVVVVTSMSVVVAVVVLSCCIVTWLLREKRALYGAMEEVKEELEKVRVAFHRQEHAAHGNEHKYLSNRHIATVGTPTGHLVAPCTQPAHFPGKESCQDSLSSAHSCPTLPNQRLLRTTGNTRSWLSSGGLEELAPVGSSPTTTVTGGELTNSPQQRWRDEGEKWRKVLHKRRKKNAGNAVHNNHHGDS